MKIKLDVLDRFFLEELDFNPWSNLINSNCSDSKDFYTFESSSTCEDVSISFNKGEVGFEQMDANFTATADGRLEVSCEMIPVNDSNIRIFGLQLYNITKNDKSSICRGLGKQKVYIDVNKDDEVALIFHKHTYVDRPEDEPQILDKVHTCIFKDLRIILYRLTEVNPTKKILCLGDSTTGLVRYGMSWPEILSEVSIDKGQAFETVNAGFIKSSWTESDDDLYKPFSVPNLIDAITSENFDKQLSVVDRLSKWHQMSLDNLRYLDMKEVDTIILFFGAIDYFENKPLFNNANKPGNSFRECVKYVLNKLSLTYPEKDIIIVTPYFNKLANNDSDKIVNSFGRYLKDYCGVLEEVSNSCFHYPVVNLLKEFGCNRNTIYTYCYDDKHLTRTGAIKLANIIYKYL